MASEEGSLEDVRAKLLRLLKQDDWRITEEGARKPDVPSFKQQVSCPQMGQ
jgi:hypothetical protein